MLPLQTAEYQELLKQVLWLEGNIEKLFKQDKILRAEIATSAANCVAQSMRVARLRGDEEDVGSVDFKMLVENFSKAYEGAVAMRKQLEAAYQALQHSYSDKMKKLPPSVEALSSRLPKLQAEMERLEKQNDANAKHLEMLREKEAEYLAEFGMLTKNRSQQINERLAGCALVIADIENSLRSCEALLGKCAERPAI